MNPNVHKAYLKICNTILNSSDKVKNIGLVQSASAYGAYFTYLAKNFSPRLALFETHTDAYTPQRVKYNAYIVYGLILSTLAYEFNSLSKSRQVPK